MTLPAFAMAAFAMAAFALAALLARPASAEDGAALFQGRCAACHALEATPGRAGPSLGGLAGRAAGSDPGFDFSPALRAAGTAGWVWDAARLDAYLADPEDAIPGNWMGSNGIRASRARAAIVRFLLAR